MPAALFGITNDGLNLFVNLLIVFLVFVYVALIFWTYFDARRRIEDSFLVGCATAAAFFPFVGPTIYSIIRPPEFLEDVRERELETRAAQLRLRHLEETSCPKCHYPVESTFLRCPRCKARIKNPCEECGKPIDPRWELCPYCETPARRPEPAPQRAQSKRATQSAKPARKTRSTRAAQPRKANATPSRRAASGSTRSTSTRTARTTEERPAAKGRGPRTTR